MKRLALACSLALAAALPLVAQKPKAAAPSRPVFDVTEADPSLWRQWFVESALADGRRFR